MFEKVICQEDVIDKVDWLPFPLDPTQQETGWYWPCATFKRKLGNCCHCPSWYTPKHLRFHKNQLLLVENSPRPKTERDFQEIDVLGATKRVRHLWARRKA